MARRPLKYLVLHSVAPPLISGLLRLYRRLFRIEYRHLDPVVATALQGTPIVFAFWHHDFLIAAWVGVDLFRNKVDRIAVLASQSNDGELLARTVRRLRVGAIRGSSSRGARSGLKGMERHLDTGAQVAIAVDGPRGPRLRAKMGAALVAKHTGALIVPGTVDYSRSWRLRSWDQTRIPKPFSRCAVTFHEPIAVAPDADRDRLEQARAEMERALLVEDSA